MTDRLTEIRARVASWHVSDKKFPHSSFVADLEFALGEIERLTNVAGTYQKQYYDCANERDRLRAALLLSPCPRPIGDDETVADCLKSCNCGCDNRAALGDKP